MLENGLVSAVLWRKEAERKPVATVRRPGRRRQRREPSAGMKSETEEPREKEAVGTRAEKSAIPAWTPSLAPARTRLQACAWSATAGNLNKEN